ncbi:MAG: MFS transporter [Desulfovibrio sp.]|jgi:MFS family permease|nr:MFS transporter [Desulfovibrio sp.]
MKDDTSKNKKHIIVFALITALCLMGDSMLYIALPVHYQDLGFNSLWEVGIVLAVNRIVRLPLNPLVGRLYSRISERTGIGIAVALGILTTLSYGFLQGLFWWVLARCLWGFAWSLLRLGSLFCILKLSSPETRGAYNGLYNGLYRLGSLAGMFGGGLLADTLGFSICAAIFALGTACALPILTLMPQSDDGQQARPEQPSLLDGLHLAARSRETMLTVLCGGTIALVLQGVLASTLSHLVSTHTNGGLQWGELALGAGTLAGFFQALRWCWEPWLAPLTGGLADSRYGWRRMLRFSFGLGGVAFALLALSLPLPLWFGVLLCAQAAATALTTLVDAGAADVATEEGGRSLLMTYALLVDMGAAFGPLLAYGLEAALGINFVYTFCGVCFIIMAVMRKPLAARGK